MGLKCEKYIRTCACICLVLIKIMYWIDLEFSYRTKKIKIILFSKSFFMRCGSLKNKHYVDCSCQAITCLQCSFPKGEQHELSMPRLIGDMLILLINAMFGFHQTAITANPNKVISLACSFMCYQ